MPVEPATDRRLGNAALIVTTVILMIVGVTAAIAFRPKGDIDIPAAWRSNSDYTLVIFGRDSCPACLASRDFHKELAAAAAKNGIRTVAALTASIEDTATFASSLGLPADHAIRANPAPEHLKSVPTVVIVNRSGEILKKTEGALPVDKQRALMNFVTNLR
jgi:thioredoxin-related protein